MFYNTEKDHVTHFSIDYNQALRCFYKNFIHQQHRNSEQRQKGSSASELPEITENKPIVAMVAGS